MKEIGILFNPMMVDALLEGRKTMTRRVVSVPDLIEHPDRFRLVGNSNTMDVSRPAIEYDDRIWYEWQLTNSNEASWVERCRWKAGDLLYVREQHYQYGKWVYEGLTKKGKLKSKFVPLDNEILFSPVLHTLGETFNLDVKPNSYRLEGWYKRNSLFMPKDTARIWLQVEEVRVERLNDITPEDAMAEGIVCYGSAEDWMEYVRQQPESDDRNTLVKNESTILAKGAGLKFCKSYLTDIFTPKEFAVTDPKSSFLGLFYHINPPKNPNLSAPENNPWLWVIKFKILSIGGKPYGYEA